MNAAQTTNSTLTRSRRGKGAGFTLAEVLVSMTIFSLLMGMIVSFNVESIKSMFVSEQKAIINKDMRMLTSQMSDDARYASFFVLYSNYTATSRNTTAQELQQGNSGDFLVLVFYGSPATGAPVNVRPVSEIVGYYREPYSLSNQLSLDPITNASSSLMPVHRFDLTVGHGLSANQYLEVTNIPSGGTSTTIEALLPNDAAATIASHPIVVQLAKGLNDGLLFHNFWGKSIMINAEIVQGNNYDSVSDTYNFTISPRG